MSAYKERETRAEIFSFPEPVIVVVVQEEQNDTSQERKILTSSNFVIGEDSRILVDDSVVEDGLGLVTKTEEDLRERLKKLHEKKQEIAEKKQKHGPGRRLSKAERKRLYQELGIEREEENLRREFERTTNFLTTIRETLTSPSPSAITLTFNRNHEGIVGFGINREEQLWWEFINEKKVGEAWKLLEEDPDTFLFVQEGFVRRVNLERAKRLPREKEEEARRVWVEFTERVDSMDEREVSRITPILRKTMDFVQEKAIKL